MRDRTGTNRHVTPTLAVSHDERGRVHEPPSGRVAFDHRGQAVWEMRTEDQRFVRDASTTLVRKLNAPSLSLEQTGIFKRQQPQQHAPGWKPAVPIEGGSPYDRLGPIAAKTAVKRAGPPRTAAKIIVTSRKPPGLLDRLQEWVGTKPRHRG
jgi:hypothetical protein